MESVAKLSQNLQEKDKFSGKVSEKYDVLLQESEKQKDELREILDGHISEIHNNVRKTVQVFEECSLLLK